MNNMDKINDLRKRMTKVEDRIEEIYRFYENHLKRLHKDSQSNESKEKKQ